MGCNSQCKCQFDWPLDTLGLKRDPINSEKAWLDYAVRLLSREASGRGRGQESVWGAACKPAWWDSEVGLAWKNPTANPKDTKATLQRKYEALEKHLRAENRFPNEMEEEARLWSIGNHKELYLLTSFTSLLGRVSSVHSAAIETKYKSKDLKAEISHSLLKDIKTCLNATLKEIEKIEAPDLSVTNKRKLCENLGETIVPKKMLKIVPPTNSQDNLVTPHEPLKLNIASEISNLSTKLLDKHRQNRKNVAGSSISTQAGNKFEETTMHSANNHNASSTIYVTNNSPISNISSSEDLSSLLSQKTCHEKIQTVDSNLKVAPLQKTTASYCIQASAPPNITQGTCILNSDLSTCSVINPITDANYLFSNENIFSLVPINKSKQEQTEQEMTDYSISDPLSNFDKTLISSNSSSPNLIDGAANSPSRLSIDSDASTLSLKTSDHGYNSDENISALDFLDDFLNSDESSEILDTDTAFFENCFDDFE